MDWGLSRYSEGSQRVVLRVNLSLLGKLLRFGDICVLSFLVASNEEENQQTSDLSKVDPVPWPVIDAQLTDAFADRLYVSEVAQREAADANLNASPSLLVAELAQLFRKEVCLPDLDHALTIVHSGAFMHEISNAHFSLAKNEGRGA